jgi:hypothetical protein
MSVRFLFSPQKQAVFVILSEAKDLKRNVLMLQILRFAQDDKLSVPLW